VSGFLLDTNVISLLSPFTKAPEPRFVNWLMEREKQEELFLSAVSIEEIEKGIRLLEGKGAAAKASSLSAFLLGLVSGFDGRILPVDTSVALSAGRMEAAAQLSGYQPGMADALIAATGKVHDLTILTYNLKHFQQFAVRILSPAEIAF
jgi:toxin FitB